MSGIVGSSHNIRGSGIVAKLGTDGQVFTSAGAGIKQTYEAAGGGSWNLIKTITASSDDTIEFIDGSNDVVLDTTYRKYIWNLNNIHPSAADELEVRFSLDAGSNYNVALTGGLIYAYLAVSGGTDQNYTQNTSEDVQGSTSAGVKLMSGNQMGIGNDESLCGTFELWNPGDTTFTKIFNGRTNIISNDATDNNYNHHCWGQVSTTSAVDGVQFIMGSGTIDSGFFSLYGLST